MNGAITYPLSLLLGLYVACCLFLYVAQRGFIYFPTAEVSNPLAQDLRITSGEETLQVWQLNSGTEQAIIYFGGNAEDVAGNSREFSATFTASTIYLVNYRGYGASTGSPSETGLFGDAEAVYDFVEQRHHRVHAIGRSLGSGVAVHLASVRPVDKLVLVTPYDSIKNIAQSSMPIFPVSLLLKDRYESWRLAGELKNHTLALLAEHDKIIPMANSKVLIASFQPSLIVTKVIPGVDHNSISVMPSYWQAIHEFLKEMGSE